MISTKPPFNIKLFIPRTKEDVAKLKQIKVLDIMSGMSQNFHPEGLFSTEIFGKVGTALRQQNFAYIDLQVNVFPPVYFKAICELKELYGNIMASKSYAIFDYKLKDFVPSDITEGFTGFKYFMDHFDQIDFARNDSSKRDMNIRFIERYKKNSFMNKFLVLPAGLRDYTFDANGKPSEDEINTLYRRVIALSNMFEGSYIQRNEESIDSNRYNLQIAINNIYIYITNILKGKSKFIQANWGRRAIRYSTRNVITPYVSSLKSIDDPQRVSSTQHVVGLYQFIRTITPKAIHAIRDGFLSKVFEGQNLPYKLVNPKTLKSEHVTLDSKHYDDWMTSNGLEKKFHMLRIKDIRHLPVKVGEYYLGLTLRTKKMTLSGIESTFWKFIQSVDEVPEELREDAIITPITIMELFYGSIYDIAEITPATNTRYPITMHGSIFPTYTYLKTTIKGQASYQLNDAFEPTTLAKEFPTPGDEFFDSQSPPSQHLGRAGGDYDGDQMSLIGYVVDDSLSECKRILNTVTYHKSPDGGLAFSADNDVISLVLKNIS